MARGVKGSGKPRAFGDIFNRYKTFDPATEGFGSTQSWKHAFNERMGYEEARETLGGGNSYLSKALSALGLSVMPMSLDELKKTYRQMIFKHHPDRGGDTKIAQEIIAAYTVLERQF